MTKPKVSVVMVVCNVERFLAEAIESILAQTFRDFEFVIVDFGSTDKSPFIVSGYGANDNRVKLHAIPNCGLAEARNAGVRFAQGKYIAIMDADDVSLPDRLASQVDFMERHPEICVLGGAVQWIDATGRDLVIWENPTGNSEIQLALLERCPLWQPTVVLRRQAFLDIGEYRPAFAQAEDYDLWLRMAERFQIANLKQVVLKYRIHPRQVSLRKRTQQTLGVLAARVGASSRRKGIPDPLDSVSEINTEILAALGVTEANLKRELISEKVKWTRNMCMAGEYSAALESALETLQSDVDFVDRRQIAELYLIVADLYWKQRKFRSSIFAAVQATVTRPAVAGRPLKSMLQRLRRASSPDFS